MSSPWLDRVHAYCDSLDSTMAELREQVAQVRSALMRGESDELRLKSAVLETSMSVLRELITQRKQLLESAPGDQRHDTLGDTLRAIPGPHASSLGERCRRLARDLQQIHRDVLALFVAEYHLVQTTEDLLSLLTSGSLAYATYDRPGMDSSTPKSTGQVFDRAA